MILRRNLSFFLESRFNTFSGTRPSPSGNLLQAESRGPLGDASRTLW